jgi:hypothetical protein
MAAAIRVMAPNRPVFVCANKQDAACRYSDQRTVLCVQQLRKLAILFLDFAHKIGV